MLKITIPAFELYDPNTSEFVSCKETDLSLEHSLVSLSKWESKWHKPYLAKDQQRTQDEVIDYIRCMTLTQNVDQNVYRGLTQSNLNSVIEYIQDPMTATWFSNPEGAAPSRKVLTSEVIYGWMVGLSIPFECQKWHLNRLLTLIRVCSENNKEPKKMNKAATMASNHSLNKARKGRLHSKG